MSLTTIALDPGNFQIKVCDGTEQPRSIRSVQYRLPRGVNALKALRNSPIIEFEDGTRYHVGHQAFKYASQEQTVTTDKAQLARLHFYSAIAQTAGDVRLIVSHHSPEVYAHVLTASLAGKHSFKRNGQQHQVNVVNVEVVPEGIGAYWQAQAAGFTSNSGYSIVLDLGGSSWLYRVIDADGDIIAGDVGDRFGSYHLAKQIAADDRLKTPLRRFGITSPDVGSILDGFTRGHCYQETGISWAAWFPEYLDPWFKQILGTVQSACTAHLPSTRRFIVAGGAAHLVEAKLRGVNPFVVMPNPEFANVQGMFYHAAPVSDRLLTIVA
ncbi:hypothetical protein [Leptolyngbya sp. FACHB-711]|uniref:ParM/StbA family protein n=1 Tax=Leptolyngbya sp. FACHB-711 TaxID=2692813 RepID=UPI001682C58A|nr:hypothetical protein [Leptolyngbya sp. FACHB-711]MBD2025248.1 hypothetical protein [Leptolyngbya sp. FACHB-711]